MASAVDPWGYHLIINARNSDHDAITSYDVIYDFTKDLVQQIDMVAYGEPQIVKFGYDDKVGYTLIQLIETSNIAAHFCDINDTFYLDVFSCKPFDPETVRRLIKDYFSCEISNEVFLTRKA